MMSRQDNINMLPKDVASYLNKYGMDKWKIEMPADRNFNNIIVVPAVQEYDNIKNLLSSLSLNDEKYFYESLILIVINCKVSSPLEVKEDNKKSIDLIRAIHKNQISDELISEIKKKLTVAFVDASSNGLEMPDKEGGVGFARKIGMDLALTKFDYSNTKKKIILCLDADCLVERNYLTTIVESFNDKNINAAYVQYKHPMPQNENEQLAIISYEIFLRYYVLGLKYAGSHFAFPTIGSTIVCDYESYIKIGGMNKRAAAEDFYFMEKLAKIINIDKINATKVIPSSRTSWRVPFGTGKRMMRFFEKTHDEYSLYEPEIFITLKKWLEVFNQSQILKTEEYLAQAKIINGSLHNFLVQNNFKDSWEKILNNSKTKEQIQKQKIIWFDGFRTLKLIHYLRDDAFPSINMFDALDRMLIEAGACRIERKEFIPGIKKQQEYLNILRKLT